MDTSSVLCNVHYERKQGGQAMRRTDIAWAKVNVANLARINPGTNCR